MKYSDPEKYKIVTSNYSDLDFIFFLFDEAVQYQKINGFDLWPQFSRQLIKTEINEGRHWKVMLGESIVCIFSVLYNDPIIWKEKDLEPSVYLHRITVNPLFKGQRVLNIVKDWAINHTREKNKMYLRMDTWGHNKNIRNYYVACGFDYLGQQYLDEVKDQMPHYGGSVLSLFQIPV